MGQGGLTASLKPAVGAIGQALWDGLAGPGNPFVSHGFLTALEDSGSVGPGTGWHSAPLVIADAADPAEAALAVVPAYLKQHSQGEYVFDHPFAQAWHRAGHSYYPKVQVAVPFTPATGPRILLRDPAHAMGAIRALEHLVEQAGLSSAHATFIEPGQAPWFAQAGWLRREDIQFHWHNRDYASFEDFLGALASRKRKDLRKERAAANEGVEIRILRGADIRPRHWDAFWLFYQDTGARKWGRPYLTRAAFDLFAQRLGDAVLLVLAFDHDQRPIAGALNFLGAEAIYGRYWGCLIDKPFLHFELCYYRAIDVAIELGLARVEAGAQGGHKLARGYEPVATTSFHFIADPGFRAAVADYLDQERRGIAIDRRHLARLTPFRKER